MEQQNPGKMVPQQEQSIGKDLHVTRRLDTQEEAEEVFVTAKDRLLHVNDWKKTAGLGADFVLVDADGKEAHRAARKDDHIRIDIPGPGHAGRDTSADWVRIELIRYDDFPDDNRESLGIRVRPSNPPGSKEEGPAHFFTEEASSTFIIERIGSTVMARYHGRNEVPNTEGSLPDKVRNAVVALGALAGFSDIQWKALIEGFIGPDEN